MVLWLPVCALECLVFLWSPGGLPVECLVFSGIQVGYLQSVECLVFSGIQVGYLQSASFFWYPSRLPVDCRVPLQQPPGTVGYLWRAWVYLVSRLVTGGVPRFSWSPGRLPVECLVFSGLQVGYLQRASFFLVSRQVWSGNLYSAGWGKAQLSTLKLKRHCHEIFIFSAREEKYLEKVPCLKCMPCSDPRYFYLIFI